MTFWEGIHSNGLHSCTLQLSFVQISEILTGQPLVSRAELHAHHVLVPCFHLCTSVRGTAAQMQLMALCHNLLRSCKKCVDHSAHGLECGQGSWIDLVRIRLIKHLQAASTLVQCPSKFLVQYHL